MKLATLSNEEDAEHFFKNKNLLADHKYAGRPDCLLTLEGDERCVGCVESSRSWRPLVGPSTRTGSN